MSAAPAKMSESFKRVPAADAFGIVLALAKRNIGTCTGSSAVRSERRKIRQEGGAG